MPSGETTSSSPTAPSAPLPSQSLSRWVPSVGFADIGGDKRGAVVSDRRIVIERDRATVLDASPIEDLGRAHPIPETLGGGVLFLGSKSAHFASSFEAPLSRIFDSSGQKSPGLVVGIGHKQLFVHAPPSPPVLYALPSGKQLPLPVPGTIQLFGTPKGLVALVTDKGELYASLSTGAPFKKLLGSDVERLAYDGKGIVVGSKQRDDRLGFDGRLSPRPNEPGMIVSDNVDALVDPWPDFSKAPPEDPPVDRLLEPLVVAMSDDIALSVHEKDLVLLDAHDGKPIETKSDFFHGHENCFPIRGGTPAFVGCNDKAEMALFRIDSPSAKPVIERTFRGVFTQDFGEPSPDAPLALAKRCDGSAAPGALCLRSDDGKWTELPKPSGPPKLLGQIGFIVHVAAAKKNFVFAFGWAQMSGDLIVIDGHAKKVRRIAKSAIPAWASHGIRWDALSIHEGVLRFLIEGDESTGVLELRPNDEIVAESLSGRLRANGARALLVAKDGTMKETLDAGKTFHDIVPPPGGAPQSGFFRCVETGCSLGPWHRVGFGPDRD